MVDTSSVIVQEFLIESFENLSGISEELTKYEQNPSDMDLLNSLYRKVHTLKGSASFLGLAKLQEVTHAAENVLDLIRDGEASINADLIDVFLESFDVCMELLKSIETTGEELDQDYSGLVAKFEKHIKGGDKKIEADAFIENDEVLIEKELGNLKVSTPEPVTVSKEESKAEVKEAVVQEVKSEVTPKKVTSKKEEAPVKEAPVAKSSGNITDSVVRVNVKLLDKIMNVVGELVLNRNQILQYANNDDSSDLTRLAQQLNVITTELQTDIMTTRMQPVGSVLAKFERIVRDLSRSQNKKIRLTITGKETELDKTLLEAIRDPMTHLIRNSVDHGVETPAQREENGKPAEGNIFIKAYHEGGQVTIEIKDDGNGINPEKILEKAISKGLITPEKGATLSKRQILNLIFTPGFSTAEQITNISGRGVGMDVVRSNIEKIGGSVDISSEVGEGTAFKLKIPLTLAIVPALVVQSAKETFAIPQINLVELVRLENGECKSRIERLHDSEFFRLRGDLIPVFRLSDCLNIDKETEEVENLEDSYDNETTNIVILNAEGRIYGLIVDTVLDTEEIVVKPLSRKLKDLSIYAGATIMGDGRVSLIVDALGFFNAVDKGQSQKSEELQIEGELKNSEFDNDEILLCKLGDGRSYGIPLCLVSRLEEFNLQDVEWSGNLALIKYGDRPMPLINLEKSLNLDGESQISKKSEDTVLPCVVVSMRNSMFGLVVNEIRDIAVNDSRISSETVDRKGLLGTIFIDEKTISLIDAHDIIDMQKIGSATKRKELNGARVLLVDDSPLYQRIQSEYLLDKGFEISIANNGVEALDQLNGQKFDLIMTDIEMPLLNGWEFIEKVKAEKEDYADTPVIGLTGNLKTKDLDESQRAGFNFYLEKMNQEAVSDAITEILS